MSEIKQFLKPDYIYVPFNDRTLLNIKLNMYIYNNQILGVLKDNNKIYSTCSGKLINLQTIETVNDNINSMVIENDFREKRKKREGIKQNLYTYNKDTLLERLNEFNLNNFNSIENLIVLVDYSSNVDNSDSFTLEENIDELLETIDVLYTVLNLKNSVIVTNSHDIKSSNLITDFIGTYPNIHYTTVNKEYNEDEYNNLKHRFYKNTDNTLVVTLDMLYEIFFALKKNRTLNSKIISISYNKSIINVNVKINTKVKELFEYLKINATEVYLKKVNTKKVNVENAVITKDLKAIIVK